MFLCPNCAGQLTRTQNKLGVYWFCPACGGRAVNLPVLRKAVAPEFVARVWLSAHTNTGRVGRPCPSCGLAMLEVPTLKGHTANVSGQAPLRLDVCKRCQFVWFDPGEIESAPPAPPSADRAPADNLPQAAREALALYEVKRLAEQPRTDDGEIALEWKTIPGMFGLPVEAEEQALERIPWVTWTLAAAVLAASLVAFADLANAVQQFGFVPAEPLRVGGLTLLSSFFLHGGVAHLLSNLYFLLVFGDNVEDYLGRGRFALLLLLATVAGGIFHMLGEPRSELPCIGASGGISGLIAFYALRFPHAQLGLLIRFHFRPIRWVYFPAWVAFCAWVWLQFLGAWQQVAGFGSVSALAHLGGATVGFLLWLRWRRN